MKGKFTLSIDVEDWYHLPYLKNEYRHSDDSVLDGLDFFISVCRSNGISASFFVVGELLEKNLELFSELAQEGHDIGFHTMKHKRPIDMTEVEFRQDLVQGKELLSRVGMTKYIFRAPLFGLNNVMYQILYEEGYAIDSSYINFSKHPKYGIISMDSMVKLNGETYKHKFGGFYEFGFQLSKNRIMNFPISGGAYFRFSPWFVLKNGIMNLFTQRDYYNFYIHPFELSKSKVSLKGVGIIARLRFYFGREKARHRLVELISLAKEFGYTFTTYTNIYEEYSSNRF